MKLEIFLLGTSTLYNITEVLKFGMFNDGRETADVSFSFVAICFLNFDAEICISLVGDHYLNNFIWILVYDHH